MRHIVHSSLIWLQRYELFSFISPKVQTQDKPKFQALANKWYFSRSIKWKLLNALGKLLNDYFAIVNEYFAIVIKYFPKATARWGGGQPQILGLSWLWDFRQTYCFILYLCRQIISRMERTKIFRRRLNGQWTVMDSSFLKSLTGTARACGTRDKSCNFTVHYCPLSKTKYRRVGVTASPWSLSPWSFSNDYDR